MTVVPFRSPMAFMARRINARYNYKSRATDSKNGRRFTSDFCKTATSRSEIHLIPTRQLHAATKMGRTLAVEDSLSRIGVDHDGVIIPRWCRVTRMSRSRYTPLLTRVF